MQARRHLQRRNPPLHHAKRRGLFRRPPCSSGTSRNEWLQLEDEGSTRHRGQRRIAANLLKSLELIPPPGTSAERIADRLGALGTVQVESFHYFQRTLLDRADGALREQGVSLEWQTTSNGHRLSWRDGPRNPISVPLEAPAPRYATDVPQGLLRRRLLESVGHGTLVEIASVRGSAQHVRLIDQEQKTVCVVSVERGTGLNTEGERRLRLDERVRVVPVKGYAALATRIAAHLSEEPGWQASREALVDEAIRRMGRNSTTEVGTRIADLLRSMEKHRKAIDPAGDPEELHDFRVCLRRIRTLFAQIEPSSTPPSIAAEFKWLGRVSGKARDFDVQAQDLRRMLRERCARFRAAHPQIEKLIEARRLDSHLELRNALASRRYARLLRSARGEVGNASPRQRSAGDRAASARAPIGAADLYRKALRQGRGLGPHAPDEKFHRLRKTIKKLRYLLEARSAANNGSRALGGIRSLKGMQTILGDLNDISVQVELLEALREDFAAGVGDSHDTASCIVVLLESAAERRLGLKTAFTRHFNELRGGATRRSVLDSDVETGKRH